MNEIAFFMMEMERIKKKQKDLVEEIKYLNSKKGKMQAYMSKSSIDENRKRKKEIVEMLDYNTTILQKIKNDIRSL